MNINQIQAAHQSAYTEEQQAFHNWWYGHIDADKCRALFTVGEASYSTAFHIWQAAIASVKKPTAAEYLKLAGQAFIEEEQERLERRANNRRVPESGDRRKPKG